MASSSSIPTLLLVLVSLGLNQSAMAAGPSKGHQPALQVRKSDKVAEWFSSYDRVRRKAQMSPQEKEKSGRLLSQGLAASVFKTADSEQEQLAASNLLRSMVDRYNKAQAEMGLLPQLGETKKLQQGYLQYFLDASSLFGDYLKIQGNLFATDSSGNSILGQLQQRKAALESLDVANKDLDAKLRTKFKISPYAY